MRFIIFVLLVSCSMDIEPQEIEERKELTPLFINPMIELKRFAACKRYAESVYQALMLGMGMTHPEAEGKEKTAFEFMKDSFIDCLKPYKET